MPQQPNTDVKELKLPVLLSWIATYPSLVSVVVFTVLMLYQAALPGGLTLAPEARTLSLGVLPSETFHLSKADILGNVLPYGIYGHFVFLVAWRWRPDLLTASLWALAGSVLMAVAVESVQLFNLQRGSALWDVISGFIGGLFAMATGVVYTKYVANRLNGWAATEIRRNPLILAAAAMAMVMVWDAARPFYIISSGSALIENVKRSIVIPFTPRGVDIRDQIDWVLTGQPPAEPVVRSADYWGSQAERLLSCCVLAALLLAANTARTWIRPLGQYLSVLLVLEVIGMLVVRCGFDVTHLVVGVMAIPLAVVGYSFAKQRQIEQPLLLATFIAYVLISDLRPYEFGELETLTYQHFIPLYSHVQSTDVMMLANIVEAIGVYAPIGFLLHFPALQKEHRLFDQKRWPSLYGAVLVCVVLSLAIECVQLKMPARTTNIEDVLYSGLGAYLGASAARFYVYTVRRAETLG